MSETSLTGSPAGPRLAGDGPQGGTLDFRLLAESLPHLIWSARADGVVDYWNARLLAYLGRSFEEMAVSIWVETLHPDDRHRAVAAWEAVLTSGTEGHIEERIRRGADGQYRWHEVRVVPLRDAAGQVVRWFGTCTDIEERKRVEGRLQESEDRFRAFMDNAPAIAWVKDEQFRYVYLNNTHEKRFGRRVADSLGMTDLDLWPRADAESFRRNDLAVLAGTQPLDVVESTVDIHGDSAFYLVTKFSFLDSAGRRYLGGFGVDVTELQRASEAVAQEQALLIDIMNATDVMLVYLDPAFNFVAVNDAYAATCRMRPGEMLGKNHFVLYPNAENEGIFRQVRDTGVAVFFKDKPFEFPDQPERGTTYWDWSLVPVTDKEGSVLGLVFSLRETTQYKRAELALQESREQLRASEERYRAIVESQAEYVARFLPGGIMTYVNEALARWYGVPAAELVGRSFYPFIHEEDRDGIIRSIESLTCEKPFVTIEQRLLSAEGTLYWHQWSNRVICDDRGNILEYQGVGRDITEKKEAELFLARAKETLEQQVRERTASLILTNQRLSDEIEERKRVEQHLRDYQRKLEAMSLEISLAADRERARIAGELHDQAGQQLILSRIKLDALASRLAGLNHEQDLQELQQLIDQTIKDIRSLTFQLRPPILANAGLVAAVQWLGEELKENYGLITEVEQDAPPLGFDYETSATVFQVIRELLLNVARHADTDRAYIAFQAAASSAIISVTDCGIGFDAAKVLDKRTPANGFGLFNIQQRIEHLGGSLAFESMPSKGSRATIMVPLPAVKA